MNRRTVLAGAGTAGLVGLSGCLGLAGLDEHASSPAGVERAIRDDTGYEQTEVEEIPIDEGVDLLLYEESVTVLNHLTEHEKTVDMGPAGRQRGAVFLLLTTPQVSVAGQEFNPVGEMNTEELVELVEDNYDDISNITHEEDDDVSLLEQDTTQSRFSAEATFDGTDLDVYLHVTEAVESNDDLLIAIGVYPEYVQAEEEANVRSLIEGVIEDVDEMDGDGGNGDGVDDDDAESDDESDGDDQEDDEDADAIEI
ncbi:hypothetical protein BB347_10020 [Natronorubrum daqingense]|nr:hypothetical protein BB347_10020 [Natronorubrum daqingense]